MVDEHQYLSDKLKELRAEYQKLVDDGLEQEILLDGKTLQSCLQDQLAIHLKVCSVREKVKYHMEECKNHFENAYSHKYSELSLDSYKDLSSGDMKQISMTTSEYISYKKLYNRYRSLYETLCDVEDVIETRKYTLKTLTDSIINGINKTVL